MTALCQTGMASRHSNVSLLLPPLPALRIGSRERADATPVVDDDVTALQGCGASSRSATTAITPVFGALVFKASRGIEDLYELTCLKKDNGRLHATLHARCMASPLSDAFESGLPARAGLP